MQLKKTDAEIMDIIDSCINELVVEKELAAKAYNYYNAVIDEEQYKYLEDNFGLGNPTSIKFIPLVKKHVDALVGEYLEFPIIPNISCKDPSTISKMNKERQYKISKGLKEAFRDKLVTNFSNALLGRQTEEDLKGFFKNKLAEIEDNFVSDYEIASSNVLKYIMQSNSISLKEKLRNLILDLLITGEAYCQALPTPSGTDIDVEVHSPLNTFPEINIVNGKVEKSRRSVIRRWYTYSDILLKYGEVLTSSQIEELRDNWEEHSYSKDGRLYINRTAPYKTGYPSNYGIDANKNVLAFPFGFEEFDLNNRLIPVYEVQWIEPFKKESGGYRLERFTQTRIGGDIYIINKESDEDVYRSVSDPDNVEISITGFYFTNKSPKPYSLVLACADLQDDYNLLWFYRETVIANSGSSGERIDVSKLPSFLGDSLPERLVKWNAYYKTGLALFDSSQEGEGVGNNTIVGEYDNTLKAQAIQGITFALESIEQTTSSITGVFRERLNGIQQYDAVRNIQVGMKNSYSVTKQYFHMMDLLTKNLLVNCLNVAKVVFKKGLTGIIILGEDRQKIFTAEAKYFTITDHDIHVLSASEASQELEKVQLVANELIKSGQVTADIIVETLNTKSVTEYKDKLKKALNTQGKINQQFQQLQQQLEQQAQQISQYEKQLKEATSKLEQYDQAQIQLKKEELKLKNKIDWYKAKTERTYYEAKAKTDQQKVNIELGQLYDGNPYNDQVKMD